MKEKLVKFIVSVNKPKATEKEKLKWGKLFASYVALMKKNRPNNG